MYSLRLVRQYHAAAFVTLMTLHLSFVKWLTPVFQTPYQRENQSKSFEEKIQRFLDEKYNIYKDVEDVKYKDQYVSRLDTIRAENQIRRKVAAKSDK